MSTTLPVVVVGAGPVGLAAAVHLLARGQHALVLEAGAAVGAGIRRWGHVRMFSPWQYNLDAPSAALLAAHGWVAPDPARFPTGHELIAHYLEPLAALPELAPRIRLGARVVAITRQGRDRMKDAGREDAPFLVRYLQDGQEHEVLARAVIDASGTLDTPNPLGAAGIPALGERAAAGRIAYGMPEVLGGERGRYAGRRVLVVGSGHSAFNVLSDLVALRQETSAGTVHWAVRRPSLQRVLGGGENDQLVERGRLGLRIGRMVRQGEIRLHAGVHIDRIERTATGLVAWSGERALPEVDDIVGATGFRPDHGFLAELRLGLDPGTQSPTALAPLIDPNRHSCGTVRPHGAIELGHPDPGVYLVGMKSYGRAPTFLLLTGYEQVRSVVAAIAGDWEAARRVELRLPETGVCSTGFTDEELAGPADCCDSIAAAPGVVAGGAGADPNCGCPPRGTGAESRSGIASACAAGGGPGC